MSQGKNKGCSKSLLIFFLLFGIYFWKISETQTFYKLLSQFSVFPNDCTRWSICWINELEFARQFADNFQIANSRKIPVLKNGKLRGLSLLCSVNGQKTAQSYIIYYLSGKTISETNIRFRKTLREKSSSCRNVWCKKKNRKIRPTPTYSPIILP